MLSISAEPIDLSVLSALVADPAAGAVVTFAGTTRNETGGRPVDHLVYEAWDAMAMPVLKRIAEEALSRFDVRAIAVAHRTGLLRVGEISLGIAVSAAHRPAAFDACRHVLEEIKRDLPVWKREVFSDGSSGWVHPVVNP